MGYRERVKCVLSWCVEKKRSVTLIKACGCSNPQNMPIKNDDEKAGDGNIPTVSVDRVCLRDTCLQFDKVDIKHVGPATWRKFREFLRGDTKAASIFTFENIRNGTMQFLILTK